MSALDYELTLRKLEHQQAPARERAESADAGERPVRPAWRAVWSGCVKAYAWSAAHLHPGRVPTG